VSIKYTYVEHDGFSSITVLRDGELYVANNEHPNFGGIVERAKAGDESVTDLFDIAKVAAAKFNRLSDRVTERNGHIYLDGEEVNDALTKQIVRCLSEDVDDFRPLVNFFEKVATNPNEHSRAQLYRWLERHDFTIDEDGDFYAYKGVSSDGAGYKSISHGTAIVDGETFTGAIPNQIGSIVEMPRGEVHHEPSVGCSTGLHAGTWSYASGFARGATLKVKINPRDVVSVPTDCNDEKLRVCRYLVVEPVEAPMTYAVCFSTYDGEDYCDECGEYLDECCCDELCDTVAPKWSDPVRATDVTKAVDTRLNHTRQQRDANGRFVKKA
jgi:hypothetical protein